MHSVLNISKLRERFDVRYHKSHNAPAHNSWSLEELKETIVRDPNCYGFNYSTFGVPIVRISDLKQPFIDFSRIARISSKVHASFAKTQLRPFDILISVRGMSTGKVSIFLGEVEDANISPNVIIVRLADVLLAPYVTMVLISKIGQNQIKRFFSGGGKPSLTAPMINKIRIPVASSEFLSKVNNLFSKARTGRLEAEKKKATIDASFAKAFGNFQMNKEVVSIRKASNLSERWDSHFHNEGFLKLRNFIQDYEGESRVLSDFAKIKGTSANLFEKKTKVEYIEIGSVNNLIGIIDNPIIDYPDNIPAGQKAQVVDGDILISKVRPYLNANVIFHASGAADVSLASKSAFVVLDTSKCEFKGYVAAFLRSHVGLSQVVMFQSGTSYPTVSDSDVLLIKILFIDNKEMAQLDADYRCYTELKLEEVSLTRAILALIDFDE